VPNKEIQIPQSQKLNIAESYNPLESVIDKDAFVLRFLYNILTEQTTDVLSYRCKITNKCVEIVLGFIDACVYTLGYIPRHLTTLDES
jgi:hypothetical protein